MHKAAQPVQPIHAVFLRTKIDNELGRERSNHLSKEEKKITGEDIETA